MSTYLMEVAYFSVPSTHVCFTTQCVKCPEYIQPRRVSCEVLFNTATVTVLYVTYYVINVSTYTLINCTLLPLST
jgi:hypothetical protein